MKTKLDMLGNESTFHVCCKLDWAGFPDKSIQEFSHQFNQASLTFGQEFGHFQEGCHHERERSGLNARL
jgi:hypothetical protein